MLRATGRKYVRCFTSAAPQTAIRNPTEVSTASAAPPYTPSIISRLFAPKTPRVPLDVPYPGVPQLSEPTLIQNPEAKLSTLPNGIRVATVESSSPVSYIGMYVDAGSRYETLETSGISHFLETMAYKSSTNRTEFRLTRELSQLGINVNCHVTRENVVFNADCIREHVPYVVGTFADVLTNSKFARHEVAKAIEHYGDHVNVKLQQPDTIISQNLHEAAYGGETLGAPLYEPTNVERFTPELLKEWYKLFFTRDRLIITGVGVEHEHLKELVSSMFTELPKSPGIAKKKAKYVGGEIRKHERRGGKLPNSTDHGAGLAHFCLAFETGSWHDEQDLFPLFVIQTMLGGGGSFSTGGPGKGMYSRIYERVLIQHHWVESAHSFVNVYSDSGLLGISGFVAPEYGGDLASVIVQQFLDLTGKIGEDELKRAKNSLKSSVLMQVESKAVLAEDVGHQVFIYNKVIPALEIIKRIDAVTASDLNRVAAKMLKTPPSISAYGDILKVPRYDQIAKHFG